ncbi:hypothetical protein VTL71DRAFT_6612 [Oculimacula yallundae]|uniref:Alpha/beta hydrolase fold-3 domain-containing protein n=1 Tax=Oculimacula yallundae TaxID=86028 RepID=A0ABR4BYM4_9HELO
MSVYNTREAVLDLGVIDPEFAEAVKALLAGPDVDIPSVPTDVTQIAEFERLRKVVSGMELEIDDANQDDRVEEKTISITMPDGHQNDARVYSPRHNSHGSRPLIVLFFGGGWVGGGIRQMSAYSRPLSLLYGAVVVNASYRLAPEYKFPTAHDGAWDAIKWLGTHSSELGADPAQGFIIGGSSAGGSIAAASGSRALRENLSPPLTGLWLNIPPIVLTDTTLPARYKDLWLSRTQNAESPTFGKTELDTAINIYQPDEKSATFNPLVDLKSIPLMPRTFLQVAGMDPLRDDGIIYDQILRDAGVETRLNAYKGMPHGFFGPYFTHLKQSQQHHVDVLEAFGWLLRQDQDSQKTREFAKGFKFFQK